MELNNTKILENKNFSESHNKRDMVLIPESKEISETLHPNHNNDTIILRDTQWYLCSFRYVSLRMALFLR